MIKYNVYIVDSDPQMDESDFFFDGFHSYYEAIDALKANINEMPTGAHIEIYDASNGTLRLSLTYKELEQL